MAKVIRTCWVYKLQNKTYRYLPRRVDGRVQDYDYSRDKALPEHFPDRLAGKPPKLWLVWMYRPNLNGEPKWIRDRVHLLFGKDWKPGKMTVFRNSPCVNEQLWKLKHLIDVRPITFPNGEPTGDDVGHLELKPDGRCLIDKKLAVDAADLVRIDERKQMTSRYLASQSMRLWHQFKDVHEDTIYTPDNISVVG